MPATAGRVRMPANNRVHSSVALQTHGIWQSAIGYDPYAPNKDEKKDKSSQKTSVAEPEPENAYASFQGLLALARITGSSADEARGACKKCGRVGHLTFQCRNFLSVKEDGGGKDPDAVQAAVLSGLEKLKGERVRGKPAVESEDTSEEEESESSDSDYDSEIERAFAEKSGKRLNGRSNKSCRRNESDESKDEETRERRHRGRSKKRSAHKGCTHSEEDDEKKKRREKRRRKGYDYSDEEKDRRHNDRQGRKEKSRRRSHHVSENDSSDTTSDHRRKRRNRNRNRRGHSRSDSNPDDHSRVGRDKDRSQKSRRHRHKED